MATTSHPRSLLSIARLNIARSRTRPSIWSLVRIDQTRGASIDGDAVCAAADRHTSEAADIDDADRLSNSDGAVASATEYDDLPAGRGLCERIGKGSAWC